MGQLIDHDTAVTFTDEHDGSVEPGIQGSSQSRTDRELAAIRRPVITAFTAWPTSIDARPSR
jgi:hypothetical protein